MIMPFGKHRGKPLEYVPEDYLLWVLENCKQISPFLRQAIIDRLEIQQPKPTPPANPLSKLVPAWYRTLAMEFHPDRRGSHDGMIAINRAKDLLLEMTGVEL